MKNSKEYIKYEIFRVIKNNSSNKLNPDWNKWFIGLTIYPNQKKNEKGKPEIWSSWKANNAGDAKEIKEWFIQNFPINNDSSEGEFDYFIFIYKY